MKPTPRYHLRSQLVRLWRLLGSTRQRQLGTLMGLMLASALVEVISLGSVLPFIGVLTSPEFAQKNAVAARIAQTFGLDGSQLIWLFTLAFIIAAILAGLLRLALVLANARIGNAIGADLSAQVYFRTLHQPYQVHASRHSSELIDVVMNKVNYVVHGVLLSLLGLTSAALLLVILMAALITIHPGVALTAAAGFSASYLIVAALARGALKRNGEKIALVQGRAIRALQEGLGGIRDVLLDGTQKAYTDVYRDSDVALRRALALNTFIGHSPRHVLESVGIVLIALLAFTLSGQPGGIGTALPVLGALALGAQRLLPALQQIYLAWTSIMGSQASLEETLLLLEQPLPPDLHAPVIPMHIEREIRFNDVRFKYDGATQWLLAGINLTVTKGARVGLVGSTGSGKSTLLDVLMALLTPHEGSIVVDGRPIAGDAVKAWQRTIAHVPQNIFLADISIAENIAFGVDPAEIDLDRIKICARQAQISDFIDDLADGYATKVGERGARLSGGQRQRIGIARALYKQASVLVFDEATSALDTATEKNVMHAIKMLGRDLTMFIVAHRISTLRDCDIILELVDGRVVAHATLDELLAASPHLRELERA